MSHHSEMRIPPLLHQSNELELDIIDCPTKQTNPAGRMLQRVSCYNDGPGAHSYALEKQGVPGSTSPLGTRAEEACFDSQPAPRSGLGHMDKSANSE